MLTASAGERPSGPVQEAQAVRSVGLSGAVGRVVRQSAIGCAGASLLCSVLLLVQDMAPVLIGSVRHTWLAASALLLAGTACIGTASTGEGRLKDLFLRLSLGAAFILWGIQQLLGESDLSVMLGDIVI